MSENFGRVLVTGGAGLIGSHVVDLLAEGQAAGRFGEIVILDDFSRGRIANIEAARMRGDIRIVEGDVRDPKTVASAMTDVDLVFHLAAIRITHCAEDPRLAMEVLGEGTFNVLEAANAASVSKVIASSSASVYGLAEEFPTNESHHRYGNRTLYGALKTFNEDLLRSFNDMYGLDYVALRYFNVYGPRMDIFGAYTEVLIRWMERIAAGEAPLIFGDGTHTMDFVHVGDIARANILAATNPVTDRSYNIASGLETSLAELAAELSVAMGVETSPEFGPERSVNAVPRRLADIQAAATDLGWKPEIDLQAGLLGLVDWWRSEQQLAA